MDWRTQTIIMTGFCVIALLAYVLYYYRFDRNIALAADRAAIKLYENDATRALSNGSGINNIPTLNLSAANPEVVKANNCGKGPVFIGPTGDDSDCIRACVNDSARAVRVDAGQTFVFQSSILKPGVHCTLGARPECNMNTTTAVMTVNSVTCRPKYPRLIGGALGGDVVACNNSQISDPQNVLWDYLEQRRVDPWRSAILNEDELLPGGEYRYRCKFYGVDVRGNAYTEHPHDRFHPIANYCADLVYRAHPDVRTVFADDGQSFVCECGDPAKTRVKNLVPDDPSSQCSDVAYGVAEDVKLRKRITVPYKCATLYSPLSDIGRYHVCPADKLTRRGDQMASVQLEFTTDESQLIEHPLYRDFSGTGVHTPKDRPIT